MEPGGSLGDAKAEISAGLTTITLYDIQCALQWYVALVAQIVTHKTYIAVAQANNYHIGFKGNKHRERTTIRECNGSSPAV